MKATLEFNIPEENEEFLLAVHGSDWQHVVWQMDQWLRSRTKYAPDDMPEEEYKAYEKAREELRQIVFNGGLSLP